jgi:tetratricopeptide (TPR) repeat protein
LLSDLSVTPIAETLRRLSAERATGELQVRSGRVVKTIFFSGGRLVFAASNLKKDRLGEALVAIGRITEHDFARVSQLMKERRQRFGDALVGAGVMAQEELGVSVAKQVKRIVLSLFSAEEGAAFFEERACVIPIEFMVSVSIHHVLYQGIRTMTSPKLLATGVGGLDRKVFLAEVPPFKFSVSKTSAEEREILEAAQRKVTLRKLAVAPGKLALPRLRAAYALLASGVLREVDAGSETEPVVQMETGAFLLSTLRSDDTLSGKDALRVEVEHELQRSTDLEPSEWLRLPHGASKQDLILALEQKIDRFYTLLDKSADDESLKRDVEQVLGRATVQLRQAQRAKTIESAPAPAELSAVAVSQEPVVTASDDSMPEIDIDLELGLEEAPEPHGADGEPPFAQPADADQAAAEEAAAVAAVSGPEPLEPLESPRGAAAATSGPADDGAMTGTARIEHLLMEGEVRMTVGDFANAVKTYGSLVELAPDVAAYRVRLAIAMAGWPRTAKRAERQFLEAVRLEPHSADLHYRFGLYYKVMKLRPRAIAEMRTALRLNPRHKPARQELEALSPKDSALTSLRKLFR